MMNKILLVDDELIILQALSINLQKSGYEVTTAANGEEALARLEEQSYDIIITDYLMGSINGVELSNAAKRLYPETKVIIFSGNIEQNLNKLTSGADCILSKPIGLDNMLESIKKLLPS